MRKILFFLLLFCQQLSAQECTSRYSTLILNEENSQILFENRADEYIYPASLTKIMTLYLVFDALEEKKLNLNQKLKISANAEDISNVNKVSSLHLKEGDEITVKQAIEGTIVKSFNETAIALAEEIAGSEWNFAKMMNKKALELKMYHTNFRNSTGLHEDGHYTTNYDLARLLIAIKKKFPQYKKYFSQKEFDFNGNKFETTNHFLVDYKGATGFKTGFTSKAGFNLMASARRGERSVSGILTSCETFKIRDKFMQEIFDEAFNKMTVSDQKEMQVFLDGKLK